MTCVNSVYSCLVEVALSRSGIDGGVSIFSDHFFQLPFIPTNEAARINLSERFFCAVLVGKTRSDEGLE